MATPVNNPIFPQQITNGVQSILPADTSNKKVIYTAGVNGSVIESILISNTDASNAYLLHLYLSTSGTNAADYLLATVTVNANAGNNAITSPLSVFSNINQTGLVTSATNIILNRDSNGNPYLYLAPTNTLTILSTTTVTTAKQISIVAQGGDF